MFGRLPGRSARRRPDLDVIAEPRPLPFDAQGNLPSITSLASQPEQLINAQRELTAPAGAMPPPFSIPHSSFIISSRDLFPVTRMLCLAPLLLLTARGRGGRRLASISWSRRTGACPDCHAAARLERTGKRGRENSRSPAKAGRRRLCSAGRFG